MMKKYIEEHTEEMLEDLRQLIAIPSESDDHEKVREALIFTVELAKKYGLEARTVLQDQVGIVELGEGDETLGILTHVDVVPAGDPAAWVTEPYSMDIRDGRIYGRGTLDDKGMVIASIYAMRAVKELGIPLTKKVQLIIGTQEEVEWTDMDAYVEEYPLPDYGFTPDGSYPVCNIEKGYIDQIMEFDVSGGEPDGVFLKALEIGTAANVVPGRAEAELSNGEKIVVTGKQCHSSQPENGVNAMLLMGEELKKRDLSENRLLDILLDICSDFGDPECGKLGFRSDSEYFEGEFVHRNIISPTVLSAKDGTASLTVNVRTAYGSDNKEISDILTGWAEAHGGRTASVDSQKPVFVPKNRPFIQTFAKAYEDVTGLENEFVLEYGGTYAKAMPNIVSWGPIFPGEEDSCHQANEYLVYNGLILSTEIFSEVIKNIITSEESFR